MSNTEKFLICLGLFCVISAIAISSPNGKSILDFIGIIGVAIIGMFGFILLVIVITTTPEDEELPQQSTADGSRK